MTNGETRMDNGLKKGLVISVGGTPDPIVKTIESEKPDFILFVASALSRSQVDSEILPLVNIGGYSPQREPMTLSDPQSVGTCYQEIRAGISEWLERSGLSDDDVVVDYTGGTKTMSAALVLAGVERFNQFTYVGGERRDKGGLGVVSGGDEVVIPSQNPWNQYAARDLERVNWLLSEFHAHAAAGILTEAAKRCDDKFETAMRGFASLALALGEADSFRFGPASKAFGQARGKSLQYTLDYPTFQELTALSENWSEVARQVASNGKTPGRETLLELLANAERRAAQSRYDDATGRLYRAVELRGQQLARGAFGAELGKISLNDFPADRRADAQAMFGAPDENGVFMLGVKNLYAALQFSEDESLREQGAKYDRIKNHLIARNNSLLAHGLSPVPQSAFESFWKAALEVLEVEETEIPRWPRLELTL